MNILLYIADTALNRPLLITPEKAQVILSVLGGRIGVDVPDASRFEGSPWVEGSRESRPYNVTSDGVAIITIIGSLVNRGAWIGANSGLTSYEGIAHQVKAAAADDKVKAVILDMHTPGGEAIGAFETAELVRQLAAKKRTVAIVNGMACSAGYAIASAANEIVTTETGLSGSIGVVMLHTDHSRALDKEGIKPTLIFAGAHKVDANPFEPLSETVRDDLQAEVRAFYDLFLKTVAKGRGSRLTTSAARGTEARTFVGAAAVQAGLADRVGTFESVLAELSRSIALRPSPNPGGGQGAIRGEAGTLAAQPRAYASLQEAKAAAFEKGFRDAGLRALAIISAQGIAGDAGRMWRAWELARDCPDMSAEDVIAYATAHLFPSAADSAAAYEAMRMAGQPSIAGLARPRVTREAASEWDRVRDEINAKRKH